jgi:ankyrin repeat protein
MSFKTLLFEAINQENISMVEHLIDSNIKSNFVQELLYFACKHGLLDVVNLLLLKGVDLEKSNHSGWKAIHIATRYGHVKIVELLAMNNVNLESVTRYNYTPIQIAVSFGQTEIFKILLHKILKSFLKNKFSDSILNITFKETGDFKPFEIFVDQFGDGNEICKLNTRYSTFDIIKSTGKKIFDLLWNDNNGHNTALFLSCQKNRMDILKIILKFMSMKISSIDFNILCESLNCICKKNRFDALKMFIKFDLISLEDLERENSEGKLFINIACMSNSIDIVKLYIYLIDEELYPFTPETIFKICEKNYFNIFKLVMNYVNLEIEDNYNSDLIHYCCKYNSLEILEMLIDSLDLENRDMYQKVPLHYACEFGYLPIVKLLVKAGVDINIKDIDDFSPLHFSSKNGHLNVAKYLYSIGAEIHTFDNSLRRPIDYACEFDKSDIVRLFVDGFVSEKIYRINPITNLYSLNMNVVIHKENVCRYIIPRIEMYKTTIFFIKINKYFDFDIDIRTVA